MTRRWRSLLMLWLALCLPLQGFAAASGLWCAKLGFHAPAWAVSAPVHGAHATHPAHHHAVDAGGAETSFSAIPETPSPSGVLPSQAETAGTPAQPVEASAEGSNAAPGDAAGTVAGAGFGKHDADAPPGAPATTACVYCAACHGSALLPPAGTPAAAVTGRTTLPAWTPTPHHGPWPQGLERPPRTLLV